VEGDLHENMALESDDAAFFVRKRGGHRRGGVFTGFAGFSFASIKHLKINIVMN